jgi:hypothetical protein
LLTYYPLTIISFIGCFYILELCFKFISILFYDLYEFFVFLMSWFWLASFCLLYLLFSRLLILRITKKWSESIFAPLQLHTSTKLLQCLESINTWSVWFMVFPPNDLHVILFIFLCGNMILLFLYTSVVLWIMLKLHGFPSTHNKFSINHYRIYMDNMCQNLWSHPQVFKVHFHYSVAVQVTDGCSCMCCLVLLFLAIYFPHC